MNYECQFSLIIATKNRPESLKVLFASLEYQVNPPSYEIIVVDDASTLDYGELKKGVQHWITNPFSLGPSYSRNLAALRARGKYLLFLDDDTQLRSDCLKLMASTLDQNDYIGALGGCGPRHPEVDNEVEFISLKDIKKGVNHKRFFSAGNIQDRDLIEGDHIESAYMAVPARVFNQTGGFDPYWFYMGEDRDLCLKIKKLGFKVFVSWSARAIHDNITSYATADLKKRRNFRFKRIIEVSLKQKGLMPSLLHLVRERKKITRYVTFKECLDTLASYRELKKRRDVNFLDQRQLDTYKELKVKSEALVEHPRNVVLFLNNRCNAQCEHCFIPDLNTQTHEVDCEQWLTFLKSWRRAFSLTLTGGEIFLTKNLETFIKDVLEQTQCEYIGLLTNGSFPAKTFEIVSGLAGDYQNKKIKVQISLDGTMDLHNKIRKNQNSFQQAIKTAEMLKDIKAKNFSYVFLSTLTRHNRNNLIELIGQLQLQKHPSKLTLVRGNSFSTFDVPYERLNRDYEPQAAGLSLTSVEVKEFIKEIENKYPNYFLARQKEKLELQASVLEYQKRISPCYAGSDEIVLYSDGKLGLCEQSKPIAKITDFTKGLDYFWNSPAALEWRAAMKKCSCIHGCNISTTLRNEALKTIHSL